MKLGGANVEIQSSGSQYWDKYCNNICIQHT